MPQPSARVRRTPCSEGFQPRAKQSVIVIVTVEDESANRS